MPSNDDVLHLMTGGRDFAGWKTVRVRRSMLQCAGGFELGVSWKREAAEGELRIQPGESCEVLIGTDRVITGYVDVVDASIDAQSHEVSVEGRDKTADLVDCSAVRKTGQWKGQSIERIAADLAAPFGVRVRAEVDTGKPLASFALQEGESVFEAIERAARIRALLLMSDAAGDLVITRAGVRRVSTVLALGDNLLSVRATVDMRDRFSEYVVKGQAPGSDFFSGTQVSQIKARAADPGVKRHRPMLLTNDAPDLNASLRDRAQWEANVRAARACELEATVVGFRHGTGLWEPNSLVRLRAAPMALDDELLITAVEYSKSEEEGTVARLMLTRADAFTLLPIKAPTDAGAAYWQLPKAAVGGQ